MTVSPIYVKSIVTVFFFWIFLRNKNGYSGKNIRLLSKGTQISEKVFPVPKSQ
jgi:hypothetical protein